MRLRFPFFRRIKRRGRLRRTTQEAAAGGVTQRTPLIAATADSIDGSNDAATDAAGDGHDVVENQHRPSTSTADGGIVIDGLFRSTPDELAPDAAADDAAAAADADGAEDACRPYSHAAAGDHADHRQRLMLPHDAEKNDEGENGLNKKRGKFNSPASPSGLKAILAHALSLRVSRRHPAGPRPPPPDSRRVITKPHAMFPSAALVSSAIAPKELKGWESLAYHNLLLAPKLLFSGAGWVVGSFFGGSAGAGLGDAFGAVLVGCSVSLALELVIRKHLLHDPGLLFTADTRGVAAAAAAVRLLLMQRAGSAMLLGVGCLAGGMVWTPALRWTNYGIPGGEPLLRAVTAGAITTASFFVGLTLVRLAYSSFIRWRRCIVDDIIQRQESQNLGSSTLDGRRTRYLQYHPFLSPGSSGAKQNSSWMDTMQPLPEVQQTNMSVKSNAEVSASCGSTNSQNMNKQVTIQNEAFDDVGKSDSSTRFGGTISNSSSAYDDTEINTKILPGIVDEVQEIDKEIDALLRLSLPNMSADFQLSFYIIFPAEVCFYWTSLPIFGISIFMSTNYWMQIVCGALTVFMGGNVGNLLSTLVRVCIKEVFELLIALTSGAWRGESAKSAASVASENSTKTVLVDIAYQSELYTPMLPAHPTKYDDNTTDEEAPAVHIPDASNRRSKSVDINRSRISRPSWYPIEFANPRRSFDEILRSDAIVWGQGG